MPATSVSDYGFVASYAIDRASGQFDFMVDYSVPPSIDPQTSEPIAETQWILIFKDYSGAEVVTRATGGYGLEQGTALISLGFPGGEAGSYGGLDFGVKYTDDDTSSALSFSWHIRNFGLAHEAKTIIGNYAVDIELGGAGNDTLIGATNDDYLDGGGGRDSIDGGEGADHLVGGTGDDTLTGGSGDDLYEVDSANDVIVETADGGNDLVFATVSYTLAPYVEALSLVVSAATHGTGNTQDNQIDGNDADNVLAGRGGNDGLRGYAGADTLYGGEGDDYLDGGTGADTMQGGKGDDHFTIDNVGDRTVEHADGGVDEARILGLASYRLDSRVENLVNLGGTDVFFGTGTNGVNTLIGAAAVDRLYGRGGDDLLQGGDGDDRLQGDAGADHIEGGAGYDIASYTRSVTGVTVNLGTGEAVGGDAAGDVLVSIEALTGSNHADTLTGNASANTLRGGAGDDILDGGEGHDLLIGGAGADHLIGDGADIASYAGSATGVTIDLGAGTASGGDAQGDVLTDIAGVVGSGQADTITGNAGANTLTGGAGDDTLDGGSGNDELRGGVGADVIIGGAGVDTLSYRGSAQGVSIDLATGAASGGDAAGDTWSGIEWLTGSAHNDALTGDDGANRLSGGAGDDTINGGAGNDVVLGGAGADAMDGGEGRDTLSYVRSQTWLTINLATGHGYGGDAQGDTFSGFENLHGGALSDALYGDDGVNRIEGGGGGDFIDGGGGDDVLVGEAGDDAFYVGPSSGEDRVTDFTAGGVEDRIVVNLNDYLNFVAVMAVGHQDGADAVFDFAPGLQLRLEDVALDSLTTSDFVFSM